MTRLTTLLVGCALVACADSPVPVSTDALSDADQVVDTAAPVWPPGATLRVTRVERTHVALRWTAASDDVRMGSYRVTVDGLHWVELGGTSTLLARLTPATTYRVAVQAFDAAGNGSLEMLHTDVTTAAGCVVNLPAVPQRIGP